MRSRTLVVRRPLIRGALGALGLLCALTAVPAGAQEDQRAESPPQVHAIAADRAPSANELFITGAYDELLRRPVDDDGLAFWLDDIVSGGERSRETLANKLLFSAEGANNEVVEAYADLLDRFPERAGWDHWANLLQTQRVDELRVLIMTSDEFVMINGGQDGYINALYLELLDREAEEDGETFWQGELARGVSRKVVVEAIYRSEEGLAGRASSYYLRFLDRPATNSERNEGVAIIEASGERVLAAHVFASDESFDQYFDQATELHTNN